MSKVNFFNLQDVIEHAKSLGTGTVVYKHPFRSQYDVTNKSRTDKYHSSWVLYEIKYGDRYVTKT